MKFTKTEKVLYNIYAILALVFLAWALIHGFIWPEQGLDVQSYALAVFFILASATVRIDALERRLKALP